MNNLPIFTLQNLESLTINPSGSRFFRTNVKGELENNYKPLKNIQSSSGAIIDFNTDKLKFDLSHPLDIEIQSSYDGSINLIINDDKNPPLLINTRFSVEENDSYAIPDHYGSNDTNLYSETNLELDLRLYKTITKIPKLEYLGLDYNGKMKSGNYHFYFKYSDVDGNETDFITESSLVTCHIGNINDPLSIRMGMQDENSGKSIKFKLSNIDTQYDLVKIYYTRSTSDSSGEIVTTANYIDNKYVINGDSLELVISGYENSDEISMNEINLVYELANSVKAQAQCQNMLFFGNVNKPDIPYTELEDLSLRIIPSVKPIINRKTIGNIDYNYIDKSGKNLWEYYNTKNIYNLLGYWPEEIYRLGIVYILPDFTLSPVFNIRGLDLSIGSSVTDIEVNNLENERFYINSDADGYLINKTNYFENSKGVIKLPKVPVITENGVFPLGITFTFSNSVINYLKEYTKGFFFVRQKRIPTILAQGCTIGKTKDPFGNLPVLPVGFNGVIEGFLDNSSKGVITDNNPFLVKKWVWRYPKYYLNEFGTPTLTNLDDDYGEDNENHPYVWKLPSNGKFDEFDKTLYTGGDRVRSKYKTMERVGDPMYGHWDITGDDADAEKKVKDTFGNYFRILKPKKLIVQPNNFEIKGAIVPEAELREQIFNQIFTSSKFIITKSKSQSSFKIKQDTEKHYYLLQNTEIENNDSPFLKSAIVTMVNDNMPLITDGTNLFSARAGEAEEVWKVVDIKYDWEDPNNSSNKIDNINTILTNNIDYVRGSFGTYVGLGDISLNGGEIINFRPENYSESIEYKKSLFKTNFSLFEPYFPISDRSEYNSNSIDCYRGDCFIGNFTHRMQRNFADPDLPTNDKIIDPYTWYKGFAVINENDKNSTTIGLNRILTLFKRNNKGKIIEATDSKFDSAGSLTTAISGLDSYSISGTNKINRTDVNAVKLGHWFTFKVMSNINVSMRDIDLSNPTEQSMFGKSKGFYPLNKMSVNGTDKLPDSKIINGASNITLSNKYNFILPEIPYIKNTFSTRIQYSDISINDAFRNGYRIFRGGKYRDIPKTYGSLVALKELAGNLVAVMENGVLLIPVNERLIAAEGSGGTAYINTTNVLPENPRVLSSNYGSIWKDSVIETIDTIYGVDTISKKIWKTSGTNFELISDLKVQKFLNEFINLSAFDKEVTIGTRNVKTHFNALKGDVIFTFYNTDSNNKKIKWSLCYNEKLQKFTTFYSWIPSFSENIHNSFISFNLDDIKSTGKSSIWKHGKAGNYELENEIKPTNWYGKQELFEFEFVINEIPINQKIFDNLKIISNKSKPKEFEFEIVGEGYDWYKYKDVIQFLNDRVGEINYPDLETSYLKYLQLNQSIKKLPFIKRIKYNPSNPLKDYKWENNSTDVWLVKDTLLNEERIHTNQLGNDIKILGRIKGNMQYLEDFWNIEIRPINFKYAYLNENVLNFTKLNQSKIRDKYLKVKIRYSGEDLTIIQAVKALFTISYA